MVREQKYKAVVHYVEDNIISGNLNIGDRIPSVNAFRIKFGISRSSIFIAMDELKSRGLIEAEASIGYYVASNQVKIKEKVLLLFNEFTSFKEVIYKSFIERIGENASVDIMFHNYNRTVFETLLKGANGKYTSYVIMSGKFKGIGQILSTIDGHIILADHFDKDLTGQYSSVCQDFEMDTYNALKSGKDKLDRYRNIILIQRPGIEPEERYTGIKRFCEETGFGHEMTSTIQGRSINRGDIYITAEDQELVNILKLSCSQGMTPGKDFGIISYNDTPVKEILAGGISTLSTDFALMCQTLADMVTDKTFRTVYNPSTLTIRKSL